ncbi:MAG: pantetheine-phosphate adenylyltransferase [Bacillota bacterium]|uniref:Phosphopantetheine adenylyltransferase n=1 Tax=Thermanaerosceptrum fracticalcis TaxID=1712410 RepID=A0A7G6E6G8_THEFR|nr:pantetheine-phosphate adenylyltransferase [Thermanaerosceptrum fracticalcis]QNB47672.1 pantetheine-phosphate adenylyltransferase [Thermanaerosceptrum fracticalcis]
MRIAIYPGTFDPVTNGHIHIAERASKLFDKVIIAVAKDNYKNNLFSLEERLQMVEESLQYLPNVEVDSFSGLLADYAVCKNAQALIRGLRAVSDFEYEMQLAAMNKRLNETLETVFLMTAGEYSFISSSMIKQVAVLGGCVKGLVPPIVEAGLKEKYRGTAKV